MSGLLLGCMRTPGALAVSAVRDGERREIRSSLILQPGPAAPTDGLAAPHRIVEAWSRRTAGAPDRG